MAFWKRKTIEIIENTGDNNNNNHDANHWQDKFEGKNSIKGG